MSQYKDTLTLYEELIASGTSESQAKIQAHQLGSLSESVVSIESKIYLRLDKIEKDLFWMRAIGAAMIVSFFASAFWR